MHLNMFRALYRKLTGHIPLFSHMTEIQKIQYVRQNGHDLQYIQQPSTIVQLEAVKQCGYAIQYIENPSIQVQLAAVNQNGYAIQHIKHPSIRVRFIAAYNKHHFEINTSATFMVGLCVYTLYCIK